MKTKRTIQRKSQVVFEYVMLFMVVISATISMAFIPNVKNVFTNHFYQCTSTIVNEPFGEAIEGYTMEAPGEVGSQIDDIYQIYYDATDGGAGQGFDVMEEAFEAAIQEAEDALAEAEDAYEEAQDHYNDMLAQYGPLHWRTIQALEQMDDRRHEMLGKEDALAAVHEAIDYYNSPEGQAEIAANANFDEIWESLGL